MKFNELVGDRRPDNGVRGEDRERQRSRDYENFELVLTVFKTINRSLILDDVIELVLDNGIRIARAERGFLLLANEQGELRIVKARDAFGNTLSPEQYSISESISRDVFATGESICVEHAQENSEYDQRSSIMSLSLETILCSPLLVRGERIGVIYVDSRSIQPVNRDEIITLFETLASLAAISIKNAQLYERMQKAFHDLQSANEVMIKMDRMAIKGEMAAEVSHELKNLFQMALLQLNSLERSFRKLTAEQALQRIHETTDSVKRIEVFAKGLVETSSLKTVKHLGKLNDSIAGLTKLVRPLRKYHLSTITTSLDAGIPVFPFDSQQIHQLLLNLLNNAVEASERATIELISSYMPEQHAIRIVVRDDGPGMTEEIRAKLFNERVTTKIEGHGYGLPICRKIVENHDGYIQVQSSLGKGTTFTIHLPVTTL